MRPALAILATFVLLLAGCGGKPSSSATAQPVSLGTLRLVKASGHVIKLSGGPTNAGESRYFSLKPRAGFTYFWQCPGFGKRSSFSATLQYGWPQSTAQLADIGQGDQPAGIGGWSNLDETNGHVLEESCNVCVTAKRCHWSITLLFGAHPLVQYVNRALDFSLSFDPKVNTGGPRLLDASEAQAVGGTSGVLLALVSGTQHASCLLGVRAVNTANRQGTPTSAQVEALARDMTGWQRIGTPQAVALGGASGYRLGVRWVGAEPTSGSVCLLALGEHRYAVYALVSPGHPKLARRLHRLVRSLRFAPA